MAESENRAESSALISNITPQARLESISDQFKDILMDLHSSMMADPVVGSEVGSGSDPSPNCLNDAAAVVKETEEVNNSPPRDVEMVDGSLEQSEEQNNSASRVGILPAAVINEKESSDMSSDNMFSTSMEQIGWGDLSSSGQIPQLSEAQGGYLTFDNSGTETIEDTQEDSGTASVPSLMNYPTGDYKSLPEGTFKIFVSNIPTGCKNEDLAELFKPYGNVLECEIFAFKNFAFVHLDTEEAGLKAIKELNGYSLGGNNLNVQRSNKAAPSASKSIFAAPEEVTTFKLYLSNLQQGVTKEFVAKILEGYGRVVEIEIYRNNSAFVHMEEEEAGKKVIKELNGKMIEEIGKPIFVSQSKNPEGPSMPTIKLQVKNISNTATAEIIRSLFQPYGLVIKCSIPKKKFGMQRKAIVHLEQLGDIRSAIKDLSDYTLDGKTLDVEALFDEKEKPSPQPKKHVVPLMEPEPSYGASHGYGFEDYNQQPFPLMPMGMPMRGRGRGRGFGGPPPVRGKFQLIPMPTQQDISPMSQGRGRGRGRGLGRGHQGFVPRQPTGPPKRPYQNSGFDNDDYDFDEYYQDPVAASSREHITSLEGQYNSFQTEAGQNSYVPRDYQAIGYPLGEREYHPPQKKPRGKFGGANVPSLMGLNVRQTQEKPVQIPYHPHAYPSLNLPLGEREYYRNIKQGNKTQQAKAQMNAAVQRNQIQQQYQQDSNYFASDQMPALNSTAHSNFQYTSTTHSEFQQYSTAYPSNYYAGVDNFSAVPFDYNAMKNKKKRPQNQQQRSALEGIDPAEIPAVIKPGAKVYVNGKGKVMVRGNRGGKTNNKKARRPGLGSKAGGGSGNNNSKNPNGVIMSGANQTPIGGGNNPTAGPSNTNSFNQSYNMYSAAGGNNKFKSKQQVKDDNQEYSEWLSQKSWLYQAIPGTVKPANK